MKKFLSDFQRKIRSPVRPMKYTFKTKEEDAAPDTWEQSSRRFDTKVEAAQAAADWMVINYMNGAIVEVKICQVED